VYWEGEEKKRTENLLTQNTARKNQKSKSCDNNNYIFKKRKKKDPLVSYHSLLSEGKNNRLPRVASRKSKRPRKSIRPRKEGR